MFRELSSAFLERGLTRRSGIRLAFSALLTRCLRGEETTNIPAQIRDLGRNIPPRASDAITGSQFADSVAQVDREEREHAIRAQLLKGNLPEFLRTLVPVKLSYHTIHGATIAATIFVMPEYLAIGSDTDFLRIPMNLYTARVIADHFECILPTRKIVDAIYNQSAYRFYPQSMPAGPQMSSTAYYRAHNVMIDTQSLARGIPSGALVSGHKKDVVLTNRLVGKPGRIAIYGWHRSAGDPIQPLSTVHGASYADYSHGIRLVSQTAMVDGRPRNLYDVLRDPRMASALSDEGSMWQILEMWARERILN